MLALLSMWMALPASAQLSTPEPGFSTTCTARPASHRIGKLWYCQGASAVGSCAAPGTGSAAFLCLYDGTGWVATGDISPGGSSLWSDDGTFVRPLDTTAADYIGVSAAVAPPRIGSIDDDTILIDIQGDGTDDIKLSISGDRIILERATGVAATTWVFDDGSAAGTSAIVEAGTFDTPAAATTGGCFTLKERDDGTGAETVQVCMVDTDTATSLVHRIRDPGANADFVLTEAEGATQTINDERIFSGTFKLGAAGVSVTNDGDGAITITGLGDGTDEALTLNFDDVANTVTVTTGTGVTVLDLSAIGITSTGTFTLNSAVVNIATAGANDNDNSAASTQFVQSELIAYASDGVTFTTKALDAEGSGNVLTTVEKVWLPAAGCNNATAAPMWDLPTTNAPAIACVTGTNTQKGVADFDGTTDESMQATLMLPLDWTGNVDVAYKWLSTVTTGNVTWCAQVICVADAETDDPAFPAQASANCVSDATKGTTNQTNDASDTAITVTGCAAGELVHVRVSRDPDETSTLSDTLAGDARLVGVELTMRRAQ